MTWQQQLWRVLCEQGSGFLTCWYLYTGSWTEDQTPQGGDAHTTTVSHSLSPPFLQQNNSFWLLQNMTSTPPLYYSLTLSMTSGPCLNIKTGFPGMRISIIKMKRSWDHHYHYNGNSYIDKTTSLYWDGSRMHISLSHLYPKNRRHFEYTRTIMMAILFSVACRRFMRIGGI